MPEAFESDLAIDVTGEVCPMTYVRTRLALDRLAAGQVLSVTLRGEEPLRNIPASATRHGHSVIETTQLPGGLTRLLIRRG